MLRWIDGNRFHFSPDFPGDQVHFHNSLNFISKEGDSIALFILVFLLHLAIIPVFHKKPVTGIESMIGMKCRVTEPLNPTGMVAIKNEYWRAESIEGEIDAGQEAEVVDSSGLILKVKRLS